MISMKKIKTFFKITIMKTAWLKAWYTVTKILMKNNYLIKKKYLISLISCQQK